MAVLGVGKDVVLLAPLGIVPMPHQSQLLQQVERAVHGRGDGCGFQHAASIDQIGAGHVALRPSQHLDDRPSLWRPALTAPAKPIAYRGPGILLRRAHAEEYRTPY